MDIYNHVQRINFEIGDFYKCLMFDRHTEYYTHLPPPRGQLYCMLSIKSVKSELNPISGRQHNVAPYFDKSQRIYKFLMTK